MTTFKYLENKINYSFSDHAILKQALTHRSVSSDHTRGNNERLEFLGDRVLGNIIADMLYKEDPKASEGKLAKKFTSMVRRETLVKVADQINLANFIIVSSHEKAKDIQFSQTVLSDACEALIGAIYLDGGFSAAYDFVKRFWLVHQMDDSSAIKDFKSALQEWVQARGLPLPTYTVRSEEGLAHDPEFIMEVKVEGFEIVCGRGKNKRDASQNAAQIFFERNISGK